MRGMAGRTWRESLLRMLTAWNRHQVWRVLGAVIVVWLVGGTGLFLTERRANPELRTWGYALWQSGVYLFSGLEDPPVTMLGGLIAMMIVVTGVGTAGLFTASLASLLVERYLRRRDVASFEMEEHLILCNWSSRGLDWIREVHAKIIKDKRPVVIIHDDPDGIELPDTQDDPAFSDVYIVKGDPTSEIILRRAKVSKSHSVVILADHREGKHADGKTILTCIAIRALCRGAEHQPNIAAECRNAINRNHLKRSGADEIISSDEFGLRLLARAALYHGMTRVYQELLTVGRDANEMYLLPAPAELLGKPFTELSILFARHRGDRKSALLIGIQRDEEMHINPIHDEVGPLQADDHLILLGRVFLKPEDPLPIKREEKHEEERA